MHLQSIHRLEPITPQMCVRAALTVDQVSVFGQKVKDNFFCVSIDLHVSSQKPFWGILNFKGKQQEKTDLFNKLKWMFLLVWILFYIKELMQKKEVY